MVLNLWHNIAKCMPWTVRKIIALVSVQDAMTIQTFFLSSVPNGTNGPRKSSPMVWKAARLPGSIWKRKSGRGSSGASKTFAWNSTHIRHLLWTPSTSSVTLDWRYNAATAGELEHMINKWVAELGIHTVDPRQTYCSSNVPIVKHTNFSHHRLQ